jgi:hypothetical protein
MPIMSDFKTEEKYQAAEAITNGHEVNGHQVIDDGSETDSFIKSDRKLLSKIDWHLLPWICLLYSLALIDR